MADFSQLKKLDVSNETIDYHIDQIEGDAVLKLLPAAEKNKPYFNALLKKSRSRVKAIQSSKLSAAMIKENRDEDRLLYSKYIIKGWEGIVDVNGKAVPFTEENVFDFLTALPPWIFEEIRNYASDIQNFIADQIDTEGIAKN